MTSLLPINGSLSADVRSSVRLITVGTSAELALRVELEVGGVAQPSEAVQSRFELLYH